MIESFLTISNLYNLADRNDKVKQFSYITIVAITVSHHSSDVRLSTYFVYAASCKSTKCITLETPAITTRVQLMPQKYLIGRCRVDFNLFSFATFRRQNVSVSVSARSLLSNLIKISSSFGCQRLEKCSSDHLKDGEFH